MDDKSEWEKFLLANITTGKEENCSQKSDLDVSYVLEDLNIKKDGFISKLEKAFQNLAPQSVISLKEQYLEGDGKITEVLEVERENTEIVIEDDEVSVTNVVLVAREDKKGNAARLEEALKNVAQHSDASSVEGSKQCLELNEEITELIPEVGRYYSTTFEKEITGILEDSGEDPDTRADEEITKVLADVTSEEEDINEVLAKPCDASVTIVEEEVTKVFAEGDEDSVITELPLVREEKRLNGRKKRLLRCGLCPGCLQDDCKICRYVRVNCSCQE